MAYYKTTFERINFSFSEPLKQSIDIVVECDVEDPESHEGRMILEDAAREAFSQQCDGFKSKAVGVMKELGVGWSSILGGMKFERIELPYADCEIEYPSEGKPVIACSFTDRNAEPFAGRVHSYRATGFYRLEELPPREIKGGCDEMLTNMIQDILTGEDGKSQERRFRVVKCLPEEATIISGSGVSGHIIPIKDAIIGDLVDWSEATIKKEQGKYRDKMANYTQDDIWEDNFQLGRKWRERMAKKLGMLA